ncbi:MAG: DNA methyltransferase [Candidatus Methanoperedens sp.]|nr:DNA methyltransferase [Candidatus Methanoperedens sp.]
MEKKELTKELLDKVRNLEGFPIGKDEDIIAISDPPYFTACPNPFIEDFLKQNGKPYDEKSDSYHCEPFAFDVSEGKNDPIYNAHSYHTKVPHKAIMRYILHYTEPGDVIFDGFCGTGMTGVAAQMCGAPDSEFKEKIDKEMPYVKWGARKAILCDLSPAATFIAYNYNTPVDVKEFEREAKRILEEVEKECGWMYETQHVLGGKAQYETDISGNKKPVKGRINYTVWSDVFVCHGCAREIIFWDAAVDKKEGKVRDEFNCPHCGASVNKRSLDRAWETMLDDAIGHTIKRAKRVPVLINYTVEEKTRMKIRKKRYEKKPDEADFALIRKIEEGKIPYWYPTYQMMFKGAEWGDTWRAGVHAGITHVHHFYTKRNLWIIAKSISIILNSKYHAFLTFLLTSIIVKTGSLLHNIGLKKGNINLAGQVPNTLYIPSSIAERNLFTLLRGKIDDIKYVFSFKKWLGSIIIQTQGSQSLSTISDQSIDYIFVDPPFGANIQYSELNFLWETWLRVLTNSKPEAVVNTTQNKTLFEYQRLMEDCFCEFNRILKPGRWMTVEFHNSQNNVWMAIQEALMRAGFVVADVRTIDKQQGTFNQMTATGAVKQDLVISAYKPNGGLEDRFKLEAGTEEGVWDFMRQHLKHLPLFVEKKGNAEVIAERQNYLLFDRMVAFHVQRGITIPISAGDFYAGLSQRFPERDGMYFLADQVSEYDRKRMTVKGLEQLSLFVHDEKSAVQWLRQELKDAPQAYQDIQPKFLQQLHNKDKHEKLPELLEVLKQNFLIDEENRWFIPDPNKQADLEKLREKALLKEFEEYTTTKGKLKLFRTEAVRAGFKKAWANKDYAAIVNIGERLPVSILQEDSTLLMYYDNAVMRAGEGQRQATLS